MTNTACDAEICETCQAEVVEGIDQNGDCAVCAGDTSLDHLLRLMAAGVTRDKQTGRFVQVVPTSRKARA